MHLLTLTTASYSCTQQSMEQTIIDMVKETLRCKLIDLDEQKFGFITLQIYEYFQNKFVLLTGVVTLSSPMHMIWTCDK